MYNYNTRNELWNTPLDGTRLVRNINAHTSLCQLHGLLCHHHLLIGLQVDPKEKKIIFLLCYLRCIGSLDLKLFSKALNNQASLYLKDLRRPYHPNISLLSQHLRLKLSSLVRLVVRTIP